MPAALKYNLLFLHHQFALYAHFSSATKLERQAKCVVALKFETFHIKRTFSAASHVVGQRSCTQLKAGGLDTVLTHQTINYLKQQ